MHHYSERPGLSLGVVTFSADQRDAVLNAVELERTARPELDGCFAEDRMDGFFVKSLESVQGDERDVILFSIGYGPDEAGKVHKQFGPLIRAGGERRLNVAVTRARQLVEVVSSMTASDIGEVQNAGSRHLRRYLDFAERGPSALALELGSEGLGTDSPFEDSVIDAIRGWGFDVQPQVGVSGFRIDIGVKHPNQPGAFLLGVECDGAMYHSSRTARDRDRLRHDILEGLGWNLHHIWGTAWYRNREAEEARLRNLLEDLATRPVVGRMAQPAAPSATAHVALDYEFVDLDVEPDWVIPYVRATPSPIPFWVDVSDAANSFSLVTFVNEVVDAEGPIHMDVLTARLREAKGLGRAGARIMETLRLAVKRSKVDVVDDFVWPQDRHELVVRSPSADAARPIEHVTDEELALAICNLVADSGGAARSHVVERVSRIFGWRRTSAAMTGRFTKLIDDLVRDGRLSESDAGLRSA
jgi:very-short-patch-repair endonuclease